MKNRYVNSLFMISMLYVFSFPALIQASTISDESQECIDCHISVTPGIVADWEKSRHAQFTPEEAYVDDPLERRISSKLEDIPFPDVVTACYECHGLNTDKHADSFDHFGFDISIVVSPDDCAGCHVSEREEYKNNRMSHAYAILMDNPLYQDLMHTINATTYFKNGEIHYTKANDETVSESCLYCHGTDIQVMGLESRDTDMGEFEFPVLKGWPNQGVGRLNPDGSIGSCTSCHPRHQFSIATARQPYTCGECHKGPDVPAYKVYSASKHGNIFSSEKSHWNMTSVPWIVGEDFTAPTCAACHVSLIVDSEETVIAERTHAFSDRLAWRLFGAPYAHPHPILAHTENIQNKAGLPLMTELTGEPVSSLLIDKEEQITRNDRMKTLCRACHSTQWTDTHFNRLENTLAESNASVLTATLMVSEAWDLGYAEGIARQKSIFDESIEQGWMRLWLFYANTTRLASAMGGGGDYAVFANGRYEISAQLIKMHDWLQMQKKLEKYQKSWWKK